MIEEDDNFLELTGCGDPDSVYKFLRELLSLAKEYRQKEIADIFADHKDGVEHLVYYTLAELGVLEHAGSYAGNITSFGDELLLQLEELCPEERGQ